MKKYNYLFVNFYDNSQRFVVVGAEDEWDACVLFGERYDMLIEEYNPNTKILSTVFDRWLLKLLK